jgi:hypothetical protein
MDNIVNCDGAQLIGFAEAWDGLGFGDQLHIKDAYENAAARCNKRIIKRGIRVLGPYNADIAVRLQKWVNKHERA